MTHNPIRTGLIGFGMGGQVFHGPLLSSNPGFLLQAVSGSHFPAFAARYPGVIHRTPQEILEDPLVELVVISSPNPTHGPLTRMALEAGKHVVVDKPFCLSREEAIQLTTLAQKKNLLLSVFQNRRWDGDFLTVKSLLDQRALGPVVSFESNFHRYRLGVRDSWKEQESQGGGILWDLGIHLIDQAVQLFGLPRGASLDQRTTRPEANSPDDFELTLEYGPSKRVILRAAMVRPWTGPRFVVHGLKGSWVKFGLDPQEARLKSGEPVRAPNWGEESQESWGEAFLEENQFRPQKIKTLPGDYPEFYRRVFLALRNSQPAPVPGEEIVPLIGLVEDLLGASHHPPAG